MQTSQKTLEADRLIEASEFQVGPLNTLQNKEPLTATKVIKTNQLETCLNVNKAQPLDQTPTLSNDAYNFQEFSFVQENKKEPDPILEINSFMEEGTEQGRLNSIQNHASQSSQVKLGSQCNLTKNEKFLIDDDYYPNANNPPFVTCKSYVVIDTKNQKVLHGKSSGEVREMASLTKMMTAITSIELAQELKLDLYKTYFKVSSRAASTIGTTANLISN